MKSSQYDLLIFDWDGTLSDSIGWIVMCLRHAAEATDLPIPPDPLARSVIGLSLQEAMDTLFPGIGLDTQQALMQHYRRHYHSQPLESLRLFEGVRDMLEECLALGYQLAVATGKARSGLAPALKASGTEPLFHATRCADETASKPHPRMVLEILDELAIRPERALIIGDSPYDLQMAANAGVDGVAVACGSHSHAFLMELGPLACLEQTRDLSRFLLDFKGPLK